MFSTHAGACRPAHIATVGLSLATGVATAVLLAACGNKVATPTPQVSAPQASAPTAQVDLARLQNIDKEPGAWLTTGRDAGKTHYSPLEQINRQTAARLGFAWELKTGTNRGME